MKESLKPNLGAIVWPLMQLLEVELPGQEGVVREPLPHVWALPTALVSYFIQTKPAWLPGSDVPWLVGEFYFRK